MKFVISGAAFAPSRNEAMFKLHHQLLRAKGSRTKVIRNGLSDILLLLRSTGRVTSDVAKDSTGS
jgi:hypothetical protein